MLIPIKGQLGLIKQQIAIWGLCKCHGCKIRLGSGEHRSSQILLPFHVYRNHRHWHRLESSLEKYQFNNYIASDIFTGLYIWVSVWKSLFWRFVTVQYTCTVRAIRNWIHSVRDACNVVYSFYNWKIISENVCFLWGWWAGH